MELPDVTRLQDTDLGYFLNLCGVSKSFPIQLVNLASGSYILHFGQQSLSWTYCRHFLPLRSVFGQQYLWKLLQDFVSFACLFWNNPSFQCYRITFNRTVRDPAIDAQSLQMHRRLISFTLKVIYLHAYVKLPLFSNPTNMYIKVQASSNSLQIVSGS